jgi:sec-independent protein translocase protein TatC
MSSFDDTQGSGAAPGAGSSSAIGGALEKVRRTMGGSTVPPAPPPPPGDEDDDEEGMVRMSFMDHLAELRTRLLRMVAGIVVAAIACLTISYPLWDFVSKPATEALKSLGVNPPELVMTTPMEGFNIIWFKLPLLVSIFVASPWVLYQVWAFIAPGLYRRERRWAAPFIIISAGLFILGGFFAYFVVFRFGLTFLLGIGIGHYVRPMVTISEYFDLFVNVMLGVGLVFELPVLIFFLTLLRILSPAFLIRHSRYAILAIFILAAIITPTPDVFNLMLFATPMCLLFYLGVFASYLLVLHRENRRFPWKVFAIIVLGVLMLLAGVLYLAITKYGYHVVRTWPFLIH